jgi:hypothetical protein
MGNFNRNWYSTTESKRNAKIKNPVMEMKNPFWAQDPICQLSWLSLKPEGLSRSGPITLKNS